MIRGRLRGAGLVLAAVTLLSSFSSNYHHPHLSMVVHGSPIGPPSDMTVQAKAEAAAATPSLPTGDYSFDTKFRTQLILKGLRSDKPPLEILDEKLPDPNANGQLDFSLFMRAWDTKPFQCTPIIEAKPANGKEGR